MCRESINCLSHKCEKEFTSSCLSLCNDISVFNAIFVITSHSLENVLQLHTKDLDNLIKVWMKAETLSYLLCNTVFSSFRDIGQKPFHKISERTVSVITDVNAPNTGNPMDEWLLLINQ